MLIPSQYTPNKRFYTEWTSEDNIVYRLYVIPSNADYSSGAQDFLLPDDFVLRDMKLDSSLGDLPTGLRSDVLEMSVNIAALQGSADLNNLREQLLKGTTTQLVPLNSDGSQYLATISNSYHKAPTQAERQFNVFNAFILLYNDSYGFAPNDWKPLFIGCQKYSAENELEITPLQNSVPFKMELHDLTRCVGEMITPTIWKAALRCEDTQIEIASGIFRSEKEEYRFFQTGENYKVGNETVNLADVLDGRFWSYVSTFKRLSSKIGTMYSAYMRAILRNNSCQFIAPTFYGDSVRFLDNAMSDIDADFLCYVAEVWENVSGAGLQLLSGAHADNQMFAQYGNFHEVLKSLVEGSCEICRFSYTRTAGTPDVYTCTLTSQFPYGSTNINTKVFNQDNTYSGLKIKLFSETLKSAKISVSSINGDADTTEYKYEEQGTSGDNSKDLKIMFHNLPLLTNRNKKERVNAIWGNQNMSMVRSSVNSGSIFYFESDEPHLPKLVNVICKIIFDADSIVPPSYGTYYWLPFPVPAPIVGMIDYSLEIILDQQNSGLPSTYCYAMVRGLGDRKQAEAELTTRLEHAKTNDVGARVKLNLQNYNPLLQEIYNTAIVKGVLLEHSLDIYAGTVDLKIRIDAE
jgi:hypothetical protein